MARRLSSSLLCACLPDIRGWPPLMGVTLADATVEAILGEAEAVLARYVIADGSMRFEVAAHIATAQSLAEQTPAR